MDDGKANALSPAMFAAVNDGLDQAEKDDVTGVVLAGREGKFSAGFDLGVLQAGGPPAEGMLRSGFELAARVLDFPVPVVAACTGHAIAMGSFLLSTCDHRVGAAGDYRLQANEVLIGLTVPKPAVEILRHRLTPSAFDQAIGLGVSTPPANAVVAGWLDEVVELDQVVPRAQEVAATFVALDRAAHLGSKRRARGPMLQRVRAGIADEFGD